MLESKTKKIKLTITDTVQNVGYRVFLAQKAVEHCIPRFKAENLPDGKTVAAYIEAPEHIIDDYIATIKNFKPALAENPVMAISEYSGKLPETAAYVQELMLGQISKAVVVIAKMDNRMQTGFSNLSAQIKESFDELPDKIAKALAKELRRP